MFIFYYGQIYSNYILFYKGRLNTYFSKNDNIEKKRTHSSEYLGGLYEEQFELGLYEPGIRQRIEK